MSFNWQAFQQKLRWHWAILGIIFLIALILRVWGLEFGLPYIYHFDEHFYINTALKLGAGVLNDPPYAPVGLANIFLGGYGVYFVLGKLTGIFPSAQAFEASFRADPSMFYIIGRSISAILGAATVPFLYLLGRPAINKATGLTAAGLLAVSFLHIRDSHYAVPDIAMAFFVVAAVALAAVGMQSGKKRFVFLSALAGGLAVAMKWTALPVCLPVGWASIWVTKNTERAFARRLFDKAVFITIVLFIIGFMVGSPQIIINPTPYINEAFGQLGADEAGGFDIWLVDDLPGWLFYIKTLYYGVGPVMLTLGIAGIFWYSVRSLKNDAFKMSVLVLLFPLVYYLLMGSTRHYFARYTMPLIPFVALLAAFVIMPLTSWAKNKHSTLGWGLGTLLILLSAGLPLLNSIQHNLLLARQDTRTIAKDWIETNIPAGTKIAVDWPTHSPHLSTAEKSMPHSAKLYQVEIVGGIGLPSHSIDWYQDQNFDYLITNSFISSIPLVYEDKNVEREAFYNSLDNELELIQTFYPNSEQVEPPFIFDEIYGPAISLWQRERPGPVLKIYKLDAQHATR